MRVPLRVLIIEDQPDDAELIVRTLRKADFEVSWQQVCTETALRAALDRPEWDIVLSDYSMPGFSGITALSIFKEKGLDIPYILVSGSIGEACAVDAMRKGAHDYIMKNSLARLAPVVQRELNDAAVRRERARSEKVREATYRISASASQVENLQDLFCSIHDVVGELMPAQNFYIALYSPETDLIEFPYFVDEVDPASPPRRRGHGLTEWVLDRGQSLLASPEVFEDLLAKGEVDNIGAPSIDWLGVPLKTKDTILGVLVVQTYTEGVRFDEDDCKILEFVSTQIALAITRKQAEEALRVSEERFRRMADNIQDGITIIERGQVVYVNDRVSEIFGVPKEELKNFDWMEVVVPEERAQVSAAIQKAKENVIALKELEYWGQRQDGKRVCIHNRYSEHRYNGQVDTRYIISSDVTEQKMIQQELRSSEARYRALFENSPISLWEEDFSGLYQFIDDLRHQGVRDIEAYFKVYPKKIEECLRLIKVVDVNQATLRLFGAETKHELLSNLDRVLASDTHDVFIQEMVTLAAGSTEFEGHGINYRLNGERVDCIVRWSCLHRQASDSEHVIVSIVDVTEQKRTEEQVQQQLQRLGALRSIDMAITASMDMRVTLAVLLDQVTTQLHVDAADILLLNPYKQTLEYAFGRGFRNSAVSRTSSVLGEGYAGRAALARRLVAIPNLSQADDFQRAPLLASDGFVSYLGAPLISKGQVKGVLEVFHRQPLEPSTEWVEFLETLAGQAAIAVESAQLFENLQHSNMELTRAYDATIEGWSRALDLRNNETEKHSARVTELTMRLAMAMNYNEEKIIYLRWGALLHDIGKMGIADRILLKEGPLTDDEWMIMRKHPVYAYEWLSPVSYLRPALDIPYCHHEKWNGGGYPRGLRSEQIPLSARIFAVADVWDALTSDRPYRKSWLEPKARAYIREQAGNHFDPQVVEAFMSLDQVG